MVWKDISNAQSLIKPAGGQPQFNYSFPSANCTHCHAASRQVKQPSKQSVNQPSCQLGMVWTCAQMPGCLFLIVQQPRVTVKRFNAFRPKWKIKGLCGLLSTFRNCFDKSITQHHARTVSHTLLTDETVIKLFNTIAPLMKQHILLTLKCFVFMVDKFPHNKYS